MLGTRPTCHTIEKQQEDLEKNKKKERSSLGSVNLRADEETTKIQR